MFGKKSSPKGAETKAAAPAAKSEAKPAAAPAAKPEKKKLLTLPFLGKKKAAPPAGAKPEAKGEAKPAAAAKPEAKPAGGAKPEGKPAAKAPAKKGSPIKLLIPLLALLVIGGSGYFIVTKFLGGGKPAQTENAAGAPLAAAALTNSQNGLTDDGTSSGAKPGSKTKAVSCAGTPKFFAKQKLPKTAAFSTNEPNTRGLVLLSPIPNSDAVAKYQHQSWNRSGFMDAFAIDQNGNIYVAPNPRTGLGVKQATKQDHIFKVDTNSGEMKDFLTLPSAAPTSPENPYGVLGLVMDCGTNSLYATTVTGSTDANQVMWNRQKRGARETQWSKWNFFNELNL